MRPPVKFDNKDSPDIRHQKYVRVFDDVYDKIGSVNRVTDVVTETLHINVSVGGGGGVSVEPAAFITIIGAAMLWKAWLVVAK